MVISNGPNPTGVVPDGNYAYGQFGGYWTFGCRIGGGDSRNPTCALYAPTKQNFEGNGAFGTSDGRLFETSNFQNVGTQTYYAPYDSANPTYTGYWRLCGAVDPDVNCRDRFRLELTKSSITLYVNGIRYWEQKNMPTQVQFPDTFMNNPVYIYAASWMVVQSSQPIRYHWDRLAINPTSTPLASPTGLTQLATKTPTPTQTPTPTIMAMPGGMGGTANPASIQFNGSGFASIPHNAPNNWTVETWFKDQATDSFAGDGYNHPTHYLLVKGETDTDANIPYVLGIEWNSIFVGTRSGWRNRIIRYNLKDNQVSFNAWHHIAATFDASNRQITLYLDGLRVAQGTLSAYSNQNNKKPLIIGKNGNQHYWVGEIDDVRIWNTVRSAVEVRNNYENELSVQQSGLIGNWKFDENQGNSILDFSINHQNGVVVNGVWSSDIHMIL